MVVERERERERERKKLLLINPVNQFRQGLAMDHYALTPPLCLGIIAAYTPADWKIRILDENFFPFRFRTADLVGITAYTPNVYRAYQIAAEYRKHNIPVVMGGIHVSMCTEEALQHADCVVVGEAEGIWPRVIADFEAGRLQKVYYGSRDELADQRIPRHDLYDPRYVWRSVQTSRGCPMDCDFCSVTSFNGGKFRFRPIPQILDELEAFHGDGRNIFFVDDNIGGITKAHQERAMEFFQGIIDRKLKFPWFSQTSLDIADNDEVLKLAAASGCKLLLVGIETETPESLGSMNKRINLKKGAENYRKIIRKFHKHGIAVFGTFIFAAETDKPENILARADFINRLNVDAIQTSILTPYPGTKLRARLEEQGRVTSKDYPADWQYYNWEDIVFRHPYIESQELALLMDQAWKKIYNPSRLKGRCFQTLMNTRSPKAALWSYLCSNQYRKVMFEQPIHICG
ncbi:MAG: B12-binding domain-containing radical SAM protein [Bacteroidales bacterium]|nr:B12-binding domain-containing radical SAM protein [Bacteroidales bacterium]